MSMMPRSDAAPTFNGPVPPDRLEMPLEDIYSMILSRFQAGLSPDDMMATRAFFEAFSAMMQGQAQDAQAGVEGDPGAEAAPGGGAPAGGTSEYGSGKGNSSAAPFSF